MCEDSKIISEKSLLIPNNTNAEKINKKQVLLNNTEDKNHKIDNIIQNLDLNEDELDDFEIIEEPPKQEEFECMLFTK